MTSPTENEPRAHGARTGAPPDHGRRGAKGPSSGEARAVDRGARAVRLDPDFAQDVLGDLYSYRPKRRVVAWLLWGVLGWIGAHRFYLERPGTGLLMLLTGGGGLVWWVVDAWRINRMVRSHNEEQRRRKREGLAPVELAFMPPMAGDVLAAPPPWTVKWSMRGRTKRALRFVGDLLVLLAAGASLGALVGTEGGLEGVFAIVALIAVTMLGGRVGELAHLPLVGDLVRWSHRLRLFYYYNRPGNPAALLVRPLWGLVVAPFRQRERAEARLYLEVGAVFAAIFMLLDLGEEVVGPVLRNGLGALSPFGLAGLWIQEAFMTFLITYAFATPIGAILTLQLLTRRTHTIPRLFGLFALFSIALGAGWL